MNLVARLKEALAEGARGGTRAQRAARRKLGADDGEIAAYVRQLYDERAGYYLDEVRLKVRERFGVDVAQSTLHSFVVRLDCTYKRAVRAQPHDAINEKNLAWRKKFVQQWFADGTYELNAIGTKQESENQKNLAIEIRGNLLGVNRWNTKGLFVAPWFSSTFAFVTLIRPLFSGRTVAHSLSRRPCPTTDPVAFRLHLLLSDFGLAKYRITTGGSSAA